MYACALLLFLVGIVKIARGLPQEHGVDKVMPLGRLFFAIPMAVFGSEHLTFTAGIAAGVPRWIPWHMFWTYLIGIAFICAAIAIVVGVQERLAAGMIGLTLLSFVLLIDIPGVAARSYSRFAWALVLRELAFGAGALAFGMAVWINRQRQSAPPWAIAVWTTFPRLCVGIASLFYGVQHFLHPAYVPAIPLQKLTPEWIPGRILLSYFVGAVLVLAGGCLVLNKKARAAATFLGLTILLTMVWIYLPILLATPRDLVALNFFFDTLLFCGAVLLLADAMESPLAEASHDRSHQAIADGASQTA